jgi:hypothetical protein
MVKNKKFYFDMVIEANLQPNNVSELLYVL